MNSSSNFWSVRRDRVLLQLTLPRGLTAGVRAGPSFLEEGSPHHLVTPRVPRDARIFRPAVLVASALALACVVAAVASSSGKRSVMTATGTSSEVPLAMMPDPAEAVHVAQETVTQVDPFHSDGSWIGARPPRPPRCLPAPHKLCQVASGERTCPARRHCPTNALTLNTDHSTPWARLIVLAFCRHPAREVDAPCLAHSSKSG